jgi:hypothetical protein
MTSKKSVFSTDTTIIGLITLYRERDMGLTMLKQSLGRDLEFGKWWEAIAGYVSISLEFSKFKFCFLELSRILFLKNTFNP